MRYGKAIALAATVVSAFCAPAIADPDVKTLLTCSAEYHARASYIEVNGQADNDHVQFLKGQAELFRRLAENASPPVPISHDYTMGSTMDLVYRLAPPDLTSEVEELALRRLTDMVAAADGERRLPPCMEDDDCAKCMKALGEVLAASKSD